jgi:PAS domain S-box-containing protein
VSTATPHPDSARQAKIAKLVLDNAEDFAIFTTSLDNRITSWNVGAERLLGWGEAEIMGEDACLIFTPEDLAAGACDAELATARAQGRAEDERWHVRKDGSRFFASGLLMRFEEDGRHVGYLKILRDRTERHRANEDRIALHRNSAEILESLSDAFYAVDAQWRFTYVNRRAEQWWSRDRGELIGKVYWDEFPQAVGSLPYHAHLGAMAERLPRRLEALSPVIGRWVEIDIHPTVSGGLSVYFRDISARRERQVAFENSQARLALALDAAKTAIWELDLVSDTLTPSPELAAFLGVTEGDLADTENVRARYHPDDRERLRSEGQAALARGDRSFEAEFRFYRTPQDLRWFLLRADVIPSGSGAPERVLGALVDITDRKNAEEKLRHLNENLEAEVRARSLELLQAEEALRQSQKMEAIGQLTGGVAHDFNNLLTIIRSSVDLISRPDFSEERKRRYITAISDTVDRAAKLTGQLLAFARRQSLDPQVFDAAERTRRIAEMVSTIAGARITLELEAGCDSCFVEADAAQFETAIVNLAVNARDAMDGEGVLGISVATVKGLPSIRGHHAAGGEYVAITVSDTGAGIADEALPHIFEPFFTTKEVGRGTGLGLSQVYGFAKQSGGDVQVQSQVGQGTRFTLYLPRAAEPGPGEVRAEAKPVAATAQRILVVEDNVEVGEFATQLLEELGHSTTLAPNGMAALEILGERAGEFDLVFTDVVMPGMSGVELAEEVRRLYPSLRVVLTSGYSHVLAREGTHGFELLRKPYSIESLTGLIGRRRRGGDSG